MLDAAILTNFRAAMGEDFLPELIEMFLLDSQTLVDEMARAARESDAEALRRAAHTLKSNSASFGALTLAALCRFRIRPAFASLTRRAFARQKICSP